MDEYAIEVAALRRKNKNRRPQGKRRPSDTPTIPYSPERIFEVLKMQENEDYRNGYRDGVAFQTGVEARTHADSRIQLKIVSLALGATAGLLCLVTMLCIYLAFSKLPTL